MLNLSLEGLHNRIELGINRFDFTGININDYKTIATVSYTEIEFRINLRRYHTAREEVFDIIELNNFCSFIFED